MEILDNIFLFIMKGLFLEVGSTCSGARTCIECLVVAVCCCLVDMAFSIKIFLVALLAAIVCNAFRCWMLIEWIQNGWPHYQVMHDYGGMAMVACTFFIIASFHPRKKK